MAAGIPGAASARDVLGDYLLPDEDVLWFGQPDPRIIFARADFFMVPFSLVWGGFAIAWEVGVVAALASGETHSGNGGSLWMFAVGGVIGVAVGLYLIFGRFIFKWIRKKHTYYALTNRKALSVTRLRRDSAKAVFVEDMASIKKFVRRDGAGTIQFGDMPSRFASYANTGLDFFAGAKARDEMPLVFYDVRRADEVYRLVDELRSK